MADEPIPEELTDAERSAVLEDEVASLRRKLADAPRRVRALEEQLARLDGLGDALRSAQEALRAGLDREAQLRQALDEEIRRKTEGIDADASKTPRKKASAKAKRP